MISNPEGMVLLSSLGWVDGDALWQFEVASGTVQTIPLNTGARYSSVHGGRSGRFSVVHHFDGRRFEVSVRDFKVPREVLASAMVEDGASTLLGDASAWADVSRLYVEYLAFAPWKDSVLLNVSPASTSIEVQQLEWFDQSYDKGYQKLFDVLELPGSGSALISVSRSSRLIQHDLETGKRMRSIDLAGRAGNPTLKLRVPENEIWASDYDTLVVVRAKDWKVRRSARLQSALTGTQQFIGDFELVPDQKLCIVARPFSGDVVGIDINTLKIQFSAKLGRQPLEVGALPGGNVIARDWKTGDLMRGTLERHRWFGR